MLYSIGKGIDILKVKIYIPLFISYYACKKKENNLLPLYHVWRLYTEQIEIIKKSGQLSDEVLKCSIIYGNHLTRHQAKKFVSVYLWRKKMQKYLIRIIISKNLLTFEWRNADLRIKWYANVHWMIDYSICQLSNSGIFQSIFILIMKFKLDFLYFMTKKW